MITQGIKRSSFRNQPVNSRLQYFYHLGEVLTLRGWTKADSRMLTRTFDARSARDIKKIARRVYELFHTRGTAWIVAVTCIYPTALLQISDADFYEKLLPGARQLAQKDN